MVTMDKTGGTANEFGCPFCWDKDVRHVFDVKAGPCNSTRSLMACPSCEKHYWQDTNEEVSFLLYMCETFHFEPEKCDPDIKGKKRLHQLKFDRRKIAEWDLLCSSCPHRKFLSNHRIFG